MSRSLPPCLAALLALAWGSAAPAQDAGPTVVAASRVNTSAPLRDLPIRPGHYRDIPYAIPNRFHEFDRQTADRPGFTDPVLDAGRGATESGTVLLSFDGADQDDNRAVARAVVPPDPNGDVGPDHYLQWVNLSAKVFDREGNVVFGPVPGNHFFQGLGGACETQNDGDPIVLYDHLADRWVVMQFQFTIGYDLCVAVSATPDPAGAYHQYEYSFEHYPDYPKIAVWPDGYYASTRSEGRDGPMRQEAVVFERERMLQGLPARMVVHLIPLNPNGTPVDGFLPADLDGPPPPEGAPGLFVGSPSTTPQELRLYGLSVDWSDPDASTLAPLGTLTPAPFDTFVFVDPPPPGGWLPALSFLSMHRLQYRNFGTHQTLMLNHTVDAGGDRAGIRWYELRKAGGGWGIHQQGTYAPADGLERWMGSIAMNGDGDIALGYSVTSLGLFPSIRFAGQTADHSGTGVMNVAETEVHAGTGTQTSFHRWGDYSMMAVDPVDDRTFWYTQEYFQVTSDFEFKTRIAALALPGAVGCQQTLAATLDDTTPAPGQTVTFTVTITNDAAAPAPLDLWLVADGPVDRTVRLGRGTVPPGATVTRNVRLRVPAATPGGTYALDLNIGGFPDDVCDTAAFTLSVSAPLAGTPSDAGGAEALFEVAEAVDFSAGEAAAPVTASAAAGRGVALEAAHPNPFFAATTLAFTLPAATEVTVGVFDMLGRRVAVLHDGFLGGGRHAVAFDASRLPSGPYLVRLATADGAAATQRVTLVR